MGQQQNQEPKFFPDAPRSERPPPIVSEKRHEDSFFSRLTPVVPEAEDSPSGPASAGSATHLRTRGQNQSAASESPASYREQAPAALVRPPATDPARTRQQSSEASQPEAQFWKSPPRYSAPTPASISVTPRQTPSRARRILSKLLFLVLLTPALMLVAQLLFVKFHIEWLDMRPVVGTLQQLMSGMR